MKLAIASIAGLAALALAAPAQAATDYLLQIPSENGEPATAPLQVDSWSFGVCQGQCAGPSTMTITSSRDSHTGMSTGNRPRQSTKAMRAAATNGDVDGDGIADLAFVSSQSEIRAFSLTFDNGSPVLARVCSKGNHIKNAVLSRGSEQIEITDAVIACDKKGGTKNPDLMATCDNTAERCDASGGPVVMHFISGTAKNYVGHVTLIKQ